MGCWHNGTLDSAVMIRFIYNNIALYDGSSWFTPRTPLLKGTMRAYLLDKGLIEEADIRPSDLPSFRKVSLINAILLLDTLSVTIKNIS